MVIKLILNNVFIFWEMITISIFQSFFNKHYNKGHVPESSFLFFESPDLVQRKILHVPESSFPFFELPDLVQRKILQQYVPLIDKVITLDGMKEFSSMLSKQSYWLNENIFNFLPYIRKLSPGFYVRKDEAFPKHGCVVTLNGANSLNFVFCILIPTSLVYSKNKTIHLSLGKEGKELRVQIFLKFFTDSFSLENHRSIGACSNNKFTFIFNDESPFGMIMNEKTGDYSVYETRKVKGELHVHLLDVNEKEQWFPKTSLESLVLKQETKQVDEAKITLKYTFKFLKNDIKVNWEIHNLSFVVGVHKRFLRNYLL